MLGWSLKVVRSGAAFGPDFEFEVKLGPLKVQLWKLRHQDGLVEESLVVLLLLENLGNGILVESPVGR